MVSATGRLFIVLDRFSAPLLPTHVAQTYTVTPVTDFPVTVTDSPVIVTDSPVAQNPPGKAVEAANPAWVERADETHLRCHCRLPWPRHAHN